MNTEVNTVPQTRLSISAAIINYNGRDTILTTIETLMHSVGVEMEILVIDDCSTDDSLDLIRAHYPSVSIHSQATNSANLNARRNEGLSRATHDMVLITDNDIRFDHNCVKHLADVMAGEADVVACIPRLMYWGAPNKVYAGGGVVHYIGALISPRRGTFRAEETRIDPEDTAGGGIGLYRKREFLDLGAFDETLCMAPWDDGEAHQRVRLLGKRVLYVDNAFGEHLEKEFDESRYHRAAGIIYNRWNYLLSHYELRTLILLTPALLLFEVVQLAFYTLKGIPNLYLRGTKDVIGSRQAILTKRRWLQKARLQPDRALVTSGEIVLAEQTAGKRSFVKYAVKSVSWFFSAYWAVVRPLLSQRI